MAQQNQPGEMTFQVHLSADGRDWSGTAVWAEGAESKQFHTMLELLLWMDTLVDLRMAEKTDHPPISAPSAE